jgi:hypothetical protein
LNFQLATTIGRLVPSQIDNQGVFYEKIRAGSPILCLGWRTTLTKYVDIN